MSTDNFTYQEFLRFKTLRHIEPHIKNYDDKFYKLIILKRYSDYSNRKYTKKGEGNNDSKLQNNMIRAKNRVFEIALCNDFEYFVTLTLNKEKYDRYNLKKYIKDLSQFIRNQNRIHNCKIKYLLVPEMHKDGAWHLHGFIKGIPADLLELNGKFNKKTGEEYYNWVGYSKKFGFMSMSAVGNTLHASFYIRKYITKTMAENNLALGLHSFYCSQGLLSAEKIDLEFRSVNADIEWRLKYISDFVDVYSLDSEQGKYLIEKYACN